MRFLPESEYPRWGALVASSPDGSIYSSPEYLDVLCSVTNARFRILVAERGGAMVGGIGLYERDSTWGSFVSPRYLLYYNGIVLRPHSSKYPSEQTSRYIEALGALEEALSRSGHGRVMLRNRSSIHDLRPFLSRGWESWPSYTYVVPLSDVGEQWGRVEQNLRRLIQRCRREGMRLSCDDDFESFYRMHEQTRERKRTSLYLPRPLFLKYFQRLRALDLCRLYHARLPDGRSAAAQLVLLGAHPVTHTVCAGTDPEFLRTGVSAFLRWEVFAQLSGLGYKGNDLTDADLNPVTHFKSQLGGNLELCLNLRRPESARFCLQRTSNDLIQAGRAHVGALARRSGLRRRRHG